MKTLKYESVIVTYNKNDYFNFPVLKQSEDDPTNGTCPERAKASETSDEMTKIFNKTVFKPQRPLSPILNEMLNFDEERLYCRDNVSLRWNSAEELTQLNSLYGNIKYCILKNGETISDFQLYQLVMKDQSFIGRKYFPEGYISYHSSLH